MSCCIQNSIKNDSRSIKKHSSNQHPNLHRFWIQLGFIFGGFLGPRWDQNASKIDLQIHQKIDHISDRSWDWFSLMLGPNLAPKSTPKLAKSHQKSIPNRILFLICSLIDFSLILYDFRPQTGLIFIDFWSIFWLIFHEFWSSLWLTFHRLWKDSGTHLASF